MSSLFPRVKDENDVEGPKSSKPPCRGSTAYFFSAPNLDVSTAALIGGSTRKRPLRLEDANH